MGREVWEGGRWLAVAHALVDPVAIRLSAAVGGVIVAVGVADGEATAMRDGVANVVTAPRVVVRPGVHGLNHVLSIGAIVRFDGSGA